MVQIGNIFSILYFWRINSLKPFIPEVPEDLDRQHTITLTEGQISTILYCMEGYLQSSDDYSEESEFGIDVNNIFEVLENVYDEL